MKAGRSGIDTIKSMDVTGYSTKIAGEVKDFDPAPYFKTPKDARRVDRFTRFAARRCRNGSQGFPGWIWKRRTKPASTSWWAAASAASARWKASMPRFFQGACPRVPF